MTADERAAAQSALSWTLEKRATNKRSAAITRDITVARMDTDTIRNLREAIADLDDALSREQAARAGHVSMHGTLPAGVEGIPVGGRR